METIKVKNRPDLIRAVKGAGFAGPYELDAIKAWAGESGVELPADIDALWAKSVKLQADDSDAATETKKIEDELAAKELEIEKLRAKPTTAPAGYKAATGEAGKVEMTKASTWRNLAETKAYTKRAQNGFGRAKDGKARFADGETAEAFAADFRLKMAASQHGAYDYSQKARDAEIVRKTLLTNDNTLGGAFIPEDFRATLISLKEERGVLRRLMRFLPMSRDTVTLPRRTSGVTVYAPGESGTITASTPGTDNVTLTATKLAALVKVSSEFMHDTAIGAADFLAEEFAYAMADKEDECGINGDGTSTYYGILGVRAKFAKIATDAGGTVADGNVAGLVVGSGNSYSALTLSDFRKVKAKLPLYADRTGNAKWLQSKGFYWEVFVNEASELGGVTIAEAVTGAVREPFGYGIEFGQVMPSTTAASQICSILGDWNLACKAGEVTGSMSVMASEHRYFDEDVIAFRAVERFGFLAHDLGNYSATAASRVPGPIIGLVTSA